jgi:hypothetical protein
MGVLLAIEQDRHLAQALKQGIIADGGWLRGLHAAI